MQSERRPWGSSTGGAFVARRQGSSSSTSKENRSSSLRTACRASVAPASISVPTDVAITRQPLGASDLEVSSVTLGTMTFGEQTPEAEAQRMLSFAADANINFIDTAEIYPVAPRRETAGATSRIIGGWLKQRKREEFVLASKVAGRSTGLEWIPANRSDPRGQEQSPVLDGPSIIAACDGELRRLGTDYIDVLYLHWPDRYYSGFGRYQYRSEKEWDYSPFSSLVTAISTLLEEGKIRYWALSNETSFGVCMYCMVADALGVDRPIAIQNSFSLVHRSFESELAETCSPRHFYLPLLPWSALAGGALSGKYLEHPPEGVQPAGPGSRFTLFPERYARFNTPRVQRAAQRYAQIAADCGVTPAQLAYAWAASRPFVGSTIVGASRIDQLSDNLRFTSIELGEDVLAAIDAVHLQRRNPSLVD